MQVTPFNVYSIINTLIILQKLPKVKTFGNDFLALKSPNPLVIQHFKAYIFFVVFLGYLLLIRIPISYL
jgi:hypothetical protein